MMLKVDRSLPGCLATLLVATVLVTGANAFVAPSSFSHKGTTSELHSDVKQTGWDSFKYMPAVNDNSYGEESRKYRRTVYTHDDWKMHRSPDRFIFYLAAVFRDSVYSNLKREVIFATAVAAFVCGYNAVTNGYTDLSGVTHPAIVVSDLLPKLGLPLTGFTLASPSLGLLLGTYRLHPCDVSNTFCLQCLEPIPATKDGMKRARIGV